LTKTGGGYNLIELSRCRTCSTAEHESTEKKTKIAPTPAVRKCIDSNAVIEDMADEGEEDCEPVPQAQQEPWRIVGFRHWLVCTGTPAARKMMPNRCSSGLLGIRTAQQRTADYRDPTVYGAGATPRSRAICLRPSEGIGALVERAAICAGRMSSFQHRPRL
jgi:hypothetical protein